MSDQISDLLSTGKDESGQLLVDRLIASVAADNPQLPELLMVAALPHGFDKPMLAALIRKDPADAEFSRAFSALIAFPFVYNRAGGMCSLHDSIRSMLRTRWHDRADFTDHLQRLLDYHGERFKQAQRTARALASVTETMRRINVSRWSAAAERTEDMLIRPAIEILRVALMMGPDEGLNRMTDIFPEFERQSRYRLCGMLVSTFAGQVGDVPADARVEHDGWAAYFAARLADTRQLWEEAEGSLNKVKDPEGIDLKLASWIYTEKARNLAGQYRFDEAIAVHDRDIALEEEHHIDPWNAAVPWIAKAQIYRSLWDHDREVAALRAAAREATEAGNTANLVEVQCRLAEAMAVVGDFDSAASSLLAAVRITRQKRDLDVDPAIQVATTALTCLGPRSARLLAAIAAEYGQLAQPRWPAGRLDLLLAQAEALIGGGKVAAAAACYKEARQLAVEHLPERLWEVDSIRAGDAVSIGEPARGAKTARELLQDPGHAADKWAIGSVLNNAAEAYADTGEYRAALECIRRAREAWVSIHHDRALSLSWAVEADLLRRLGDLGGAHEALTKTTDVAARGYESSRDETAARLALDRGDNGEAAALALKAIAARPRPNRKSEISVSLLAIEALCAAGRFREAAEISARVQDLLAKLEAFNEWKPSDATQTADEHAARAVAIMLAGDGSDTARLQAAREHLELAIGLDPAFGWFHLELAFVDLGQGRQRQAIRRLTEAAKLTDDPALRDGILRLRGELDKPSSGQQ